MMAEDLEIRFLDVVGDELILRRPSVPRGQYPSLTAGYWDWPFEQRQVWLSPNNLREIANIMESAEDGGQVSCHG